jgi:hypothetical protein
MNNAINGGLILCCSCFLAVAFTTANADEPRAKAIPKGAEKAVAAVKKEFQKAEIDEVVEPKGFGGSGGKGTPMFWNVRFHVGKAKHDLAVIPDGTIIRLPSNVEVKDLPKAVADGVAKAAPGEKIKSAQKNEMRAAIKYVALPKAIVRQYAVDVSKGGKTKRYLVSPDGKNIKETKIAPEKKAEKPKKEFDIPEKAKKAVAALKALYPDLVVKQITHEVFDDGSGNIDIMTYEVEFVTKGIEREMVASPDGVIPHLWAPVKPKDLPKAVTDAIDKAAPGSKAEKARAFELRASLRFGAREKPRTYYTVQVEKDGKTRALNVKPDGTVIKKFAFPKK